MSCRIYCAVFGCMNSSITHPEIAFFRLPTNSERRLKWLQLIRRDDLENKAKFTSYRLCEKHFNLEDLLPSKRKLLKKNAVPSLLLPSSANDVLGVSLYEDKQTQTAPLLKRETQMIPHSPSSLDNVSISDIEEILETPKEAALKRCVKKLTFENKTLQKKNKIVFQQNRRMKKTIARMVDALKILRKQNYILKQTRLNKQN